MEVTHHPLSIQQLSELRQWITLPAGQLFRRVLQSQVVSASVESGREIVKDPEDDHFVSRARESARRAVRYTTVLTVLDDVLKERQEHLALELVTIRS